MITVTAIVPCLNEIAFIQEFVENIQQQNTDGLELTIIIADGMSNDGTYEYLLKRQTAKLVVIQNKGRIVSTGLNAAVAASNSEFIIRLDVHTQYDSHYIQNSLNVLREHDDVQCVGGAWRAQAVSGVQNLISTTFQNRLVSGGAKSRDITHSGLVDTVYLGCWRRKYLLEIGGFDEDLVRNQDDELALRINRAGQGVWQDKSIISFYSPRSKLKKVFSQFYQYGFWKVAIWKKHKRAGSIRHVVPLVFYFTWFFMALVFVLFGIGFIPFAIVTLVYLSFLVLVSVLSFKQARKNRMLILFGTSLVVVLIHSGYALGTLMGLYSFGGSKKVSTQDWNITR